MLAKGHYATLVGDDPYDDASSVAIDTVDAVAVAVAMVGVVVVIEDFGGQDLYP